jgi:hypothetical protein
MYKHLRNALPAGIALVQNARKEKDVGVTYLGNGLFYSGQLSGIMLIF